MMNLDIRPIKEKHLDCFESYLPTLAQWFGCRYELAFQTSWNFQFVDEVPPSHALGPFISNGEEDILPLFQAYHGVKLDKQKASVSEFLQDVETALHEGYPTIVTLKSNMLPWDNNFQNQSYEWMHSVLVTGMDEGGLICSDSFYSMYQEKLAFDWIRKGYHEHFLIRRVHVEATKSRERFLMDIAAIKEREHYKNIEKFAAAVKDYLDVKVEFAGYAGWYMTPICKNLIEVINGRVKYKAYLNYLHQEGVLPNGVSLGYDFDVVVSKWNIVLSMLASSKYKERFDLREALFDRIMTVAKLEKELIEKLTEEGESSRELPVTSIGHLQTMKSTYVDLSQYYNCKGFGYKEQHETADLTGLGHYFILEDGKLPPHQIESGRYSFSFPRTGDVVFDHISCEGQIVDVLPGAYKVIRLLACAEFGDQYESLKLIYENNSELSIPIRVTAWESEPKFGETIVWKAPVTQVLPSGMGYTWFDINAHHLFALEFPIANQGLLNRIVLPNCRNIHLFAMALAE